MEVVIRRAKETDLEAILEILNHEIINGTAVYDYEEKSLKELQVWMRTKQENNFPVLVAESNNKVVAYASYGTFRPWRGFDISVEHSIYTSSNFRGKGAGKFLMRELISIAKKSNLQNMIAGVDGSNYKSMHFHKKFGFIEAGRLENIAIKFDKHQDLVFMQLRL